MQKRPAKLTVIAWVLIIFGICRFLPSLKLFYFMFKHFDKIQSSPNLWLNLIDTVLFPVGFVIGGILALRLKSPGRILLLIFIGVDLMFRLFAIINYWYQSIRFSQLIAADPKLTVKFTHNWGVYIIILLELIFIFHLTRPQTKEQFK